MPCAVDKNNTDFKGLCGLVLEFDVAVSVFGVGGGRVADGRLLVLGALTALGALPRRSVLDPGEGRPPAKEEDDEDEHRRDDQLQRRQQLQCF